MKKTTHFCSSFMMCKVIILIIAFGISPLPEKGSYVQAEETSNYANYPQMINAIKRAEVYIDSVYSARRLPGISVAVTLAQEIVWQKALGMADLENSISANVNTVYRIQSITKIFTTSRLMQLRDDGVLHLDDPVRIHLPSLRILGNENATFRQILAHVAGLPNEAPETDHWSTYKFPNYDEYQERLKVLEVVQPPFVGYKYSNVGFNIIGMGLAFAGNEPYEDQIDKYILKPLGMNRSGFLCLLNLLRT